MVNVIIYENDMCKRNQIEEIISNEIAQYPSDIKIILNTDCVNQVISYAKDNNHKSNIYFLDMDWKGDIKAAALAGQIRDYDDLAKLIFMTSKSKLALATFEYNVQAMDYIIKTSSDILKYRICQDIKIVIDKYNKIDKDLVINDIENNIVKIKISDVLFIEAIGNHKNKIHTINSQFETYSSLKEIEEITPHYCKRIHRAYIVNIKNIKTIDKKNRIIYMVNEDICYTSKKYMRELVESIK